MIFCFYDGKCSPGQNFPPLSPAQTQANKLPDTLNIPLLFGDEWCLQSLSGDYHSPLPKAGLTTAVSSPYKAQCSTTWHFSESEILSFQGLKEASFLGYPLRQGPSLFMSPTAMLRGDPCEADTMGPLLCCSSTASLGPVTQQEP